MPYTKMERRPLLRTPGGVNLQPTSRPPPVPRGAEGLRDLSLALVALLSLYAAASLLANNVGGGGGGGGGGGRELEGVGPRWVSIRELEARMAAVAEREAEEDSAEERIQRGEAPARPQQRMVP